jgi:signal transduction histidine kinase
VASVSDFNGDGLNDFAVGSPAYSTLRTKEGRVDIFLGSRTAFDRRNEFPSDGSNSTALPREPFKPVQPAQPAPSPGIPAKFIYSIAAGLLLALGLGLILWRRHSRAHVEKERNRLARDLHDDLGARLARVSMLTEFVKRDSAQTDEARKNAETLAEATREVLDAMELILQSVDSKNDTLENLVTFIVQYAEPFFAPTGIRCRYETPLQLPARNIQPAVRKNLFLAVKEALHNLAKHSGATEARIIITFSDSLLAIVIEDDGHGFVSNEVQPGHLRARRGYGLDNMRARMEELGGQFLIEAHDQGGTRVRLSVKL